MWEAKRDDAAVEPRDGPILPCGEQELVGSLRLQTSRGYCCGKVPPLLMLLSSSAAPQGRRCATASGGGGW
jgi:hypothetical protein